MSLILSGTDGLSDVDGTVSTPAIRGTDSNTGIFFPAADTIAFTEGGVEAMRIDSSGNVGIGTSSPAQKLHVASASATYIQVQNTGNSVNAYYGVDTGGGWMGTSTNHYAAFYTNNTERMRIDSSGNLLVGTTSNPAKITTNGNMSINAGGYGGVLGTGLGINAGGYNDTTSKARVVHIGGIGDNNNRCGWTAYSIKTNGAGNGAEYFIRPVIWTGSAFTEQGSAGVYLTDNATSWTSASDERLKENLEPIANAVEKVKTIRAVTGKYKADTNGTSRAFLIAQDVQAVLPEAVTENAEGYLGLAYTETIPLLVAAIKEQQAMIEELKQEVAALKAK